MTFEEYGVNLENNLKDLVTRMKLWRYRPKPSRRLYIPRPNGAERAIGIPIIEDKVVQRGVKKILEPNDRIGLVRFCEGH